MSDPEMGAYRTPEVGCFIKILKIQRFCCLITQLVKKLHQLALYEGIEDILLFVLNKKWSLSDILLLRYKQNNFGCSRKNYDFKVFKKHPKLFCLLLSNQISLRGHFVFKTNGRISSMSSYKDHCCGFCVS